MKSKLAIWTLLAFSIALFSCKKEQEAETEEASTTATQQPVIVPNVTPIPTETYAKPNQQVNTPMPSQTVTQTPVVTKPGMNPPHGQAGHRCDISVGAPLNSPVAKTAAPATGKQSFTTTSVPAPATITSSSVQSDAPSLLKTDTPVATAPGMNPPHGQEGHRCDVAVGQPLPK